MSEKKKKPVYGLINGYNRGQVEFEGFLSWSSGGNIHKYGDDDEIIKTLKKVPVIDLSRAADEEKADKWVFDFFLKHVPAEIYGPFDTYCFKSVPLQDFLTTAEAAGIQVFMAGTWTQKI